VVGFVAKHGIIVRLQSALLLALLLLLALQARSRRLHPSLETFRHKQAHNHVQVTPAIACCGHVMGGKILDLHVL